MTLLRCICGQTLGKVNGKYDIICHKCGAPNRGETEKEGRDKPFNPPRVK